MFAHKIFHHSLEDLECGVVGRWAGEELVLVLPVSDFEFVFGDGLHEQSEESGKILGIAIPCTPHEIAGECAHVRHAELMYQTQMRRKELS